MASGVFLQSININAYRRDNPELKGKWRSAKQATGGQGGAAPARNFSAAFKTSLSAEVSLPLAHRLFSGCFAESKLSITRDALESSHLCVALFIFSWAATSGSLKQSVVWNYHVAKWKASLVGPLRHVLMLWPARAFCPHDSTVFRDALCILIGLCEAFVKIAVRLISFIVNQAGVWACSSWNL